MLCDPDCGIAFVFGLEVAPDVDVADVLEDVGIGFDEELLLFDDNVFAADGWRGRLVVGDLGVCGLARDAKSGAGGGSGWDTGDEEEEEEACSESGEPFLLFEDADGEGDHASCLSSKIVSVKLRGYPS